MGDDHANPPPGTRRGNHSLDRRAGDPVAPIDPHAPDHGGHEPTAAVPREREDME